MDELYHAYPAHAAFGRYKKSGIGRETQASFSTLSTSEKLLVSHDSRPLGFF